MLVGPQNGLHFWGVDRQGIEKGAHGRRLGIGQNGGGKPSLRVAEPLHLVVEVAGALHQHQGGLGLVQSPAQMESRRRGQVAHAKQRRAAHHPLSSRQAR